MGAGVDLCSVVLWDLFWVGEMEWLRGKQSKLSFTKELVDLIVWFNLGYEEGVKSLGVCQICLVNLHVGCEPFFSFLSL